MFDNSKTIAFGSFYSVLRFILVLGRQFELGHHKKNFKRPIFLSFYCLQNEVSNNKWVHLYSRLNLYLIKVCRYSK